MLAAVGGSNESPVPAWSCEHNVAWLVADQQGSYYARRRCTNIDDTDGIGQVIDHPNLVICVCRNGDRLHANNDAGAHIKKHVDYLE